MRYLVRAIPSLAALVVGGASFVLSFVALSEVAAEVEAVPAHLAFLVPLVVDGGVLAGSASLWASSYRGTRRDPVAYLTVAGLLAFSVVVNVSHAGESLLAKAIAALPPIVLLACLELVASGHRRDFLDAALGSQPRVEARPDAPPVPSEASSTPEPQIRLGARPVPAHASTRPAAEVAPVPELTKADRIRGLYDEYVLQGMDPRGPEVVRVIASEVGVAESYVRRVIRPSRAGRVRAESPTG